MKSRDILVPGVVVLIVLGIALEIVSQLSFGALVWPFPTSCTLGITGTAANVTLSGFGANLACGKVAQQYSEHVYQVSGSAQGSELCEGDITADGLTLHYLVRDTGMLNLVGNYVCSQLVKNEMPTMPATQQ